MLNYSGGAPSIRMGGGGVGWVGEKGGVGRGERGSEWGAGDRVERGMMRGEW